jgi:type IV pilus biogenesis protein CpaD/CtpE
MERRELRIAESKRRSAAARLMNVKIPVRVSDDITRLARKFGATKTEIVVVLLKAGLEKAAKVRAPDGRKRR